VVIADGSTRITAGFARLSEAKGIAVVSDSVFIQSPDALIWADSATYRLNEKVTELFGGVRVRQESLEILAPMLSYSVAERKVFCPTGLVVQSEQRDFRLVGDNGTYDLGSETGVVDQNPRMVQTGGGADSVVGIAQEMRWFARESRALAAGDVDVSSGQSRLECDSLVYFAAVDSGHAWGSPRLSDSSSTAQGDSIAFLVRSGRLKTVTIQGNATSHYLTTSGERIDVSGRSIVILLEGGEVAVIEVHELLSGALVRAGGPAGG
jgi:lipopolysaccharide export system protein LptA